MSKEPLDLCQFEDDGRKISKLWDIVNDVPGEISLQARFLGEIRITPDDFKYYYQVTKQKATLLAEVKALREENERLKLALGGQFIQEKIRQLSPSHTVRTHE